MRDLPVSLRLYLVVIYCGCAAMIAAQVGPMVASRSLWHTPLTVLITAAIFGMLLYVGERTSLQVSGSLDQNLSTTVHIATILVLPPPIPLLVTIVAGVASHALAPKPWPKRLFNVCLPALTVGLSSALCALVADPTTLLHPQHVALPELALLIVVYYTLDTGLMLGVLTLAEGQTPWRAWWETCKPTMIPEIATATIGILAAITWWYDHILLALFFSLAAALRVAFQAIKQAEERTWALRQHSEQLKVVLSAGQHLQLQHTRGDLLLPVAEAARALVGAEVVAVYLRDPEVPTLLERIVLAPQDAVREGPAYLPIPDSGSGIREEELAAGRILLVPLESSEAVVTGLLLLSGVPDDLGPDDYDALAILATQAAIALQNAHLHERALAQASEDGLTGLLNHRAFQTRLQEEVARACRGGHSLALMMVDLDDFGAINNTYGHQIGDAALEAVVTAIRASVRGADVAARYGGDEFAVILPESDMEAALAVAMRTCDAVTALRVGDGGVTVRMSASIGVAALPEHATTREELVRMADQAAYAAKHRGKGCVCCPEDAVLALDHDPADLAKELEHANMATVAALAAAVDAKDPYTRGHSQRVAAYAVAIAEALDLASADVARVRLAGQLHDVGKIGVPDAILTKSGKLSDAEFALLQQHPARGEHMLSAVPFLREILPAVRHHHERWDGAGYPDGLEGDAIPLDAAILMVADSFDAMTSSRTYRPALPIQEAQRRVREGGGTQFDPRIVAAFELALTSGTLMPLSSGGTRVLNLNRVIKAAS